MTLICIPFLLINSLFRCRNPHSAIQAAAFEGHLDIVKLLAPLSENPNHENANGLTTIDIARNQGHEHVAEFLEDYYKKQ